MATVRDLNVECPPIIIGANVDFRAGTITDDRLQRESFVTCSDNDILERGVASTDIVTTDFNSLKKTHDLALRAVGSIHIFYGLTSPTWP